LGYDTRDSTGHPRSGMRVRAGGAWLSFLNRLATTAEAVKDGDDLTSVSVRSGLVFQGAAIETASVSDGIWNGGARMHNNIIVRLVTYYLVVLVFLGGLFYAFPALGDYVAAERARQGGRASLELDRIAEGVQATPGLEGPARWLDPEKSVPILFSLVAALLVALPIVWVYRWTRPRKRYSQAFAHTLLVVPIAITLVVFLVKGSLALAFSLAGIVAAVRFRTTLDEPMDAVYLFIVIGTGLAAGVQLLFVALIASIVFNAVALTVWRMNFGSQPALLNGWRLAEAGPEGQLLGVSAIVRPDAPGGAEESGDPFNARLRLHATQLEAAQHFVIPFLEARVKKWQVAEITHQEDGTSIIEFDLRIKRSADLAAFIRGIEQGDPHVAKVELMKSRSKKPRN